MEGEGDVVGLGWRTGEGGPGGVPAAAGCGVAAGRGPVVVPVGAADGVVVGNWDTVGDTATVGDTTTVESGDTVADDLAGGPGEDLVGSVGSGDPATPEGTEPFGQSSPSIRMSRPESVAPGEPIVVIAGLEPTVAVASTVTMVVPLGVPSGGVPQAAAPASSVTPSNAPIHGCHRCGSRRRSRLRAQRPTVPGSRANPAAVRIAAAAPRTTHTTTDAASRAATVALSAAMARRSPPRTLATTDGLGSSAASAPIPTIAAARSRRVARMSAPAPGGIRSVVYLNGMKRSQTSSTGSVKHELIGSLQREPGLGGEPDAVG